MGIRPAAHDNGTGLSGKNRVDVEQQRALAEPIGDSKIFGRLVRQRRKALGLRQKALALAVDVGERMIADLEADKETCQLGKAGLRPRGRHPPRGRRCGTAPPDRRWL